MKRVITQIYFDDSTFIATEQKGLTIDIRAEIDVARKIGTLKLKKGEEVIASIVISEAIKTFPLSQWLEATSYEFIEAD